ncbi:hypothetical protein IQ07DRAFT_643676 [Pyrenochaeta sp. DS3sAY3a]|nr:hypothetical protein IQ07DRAFT_643676 [Pyrenochaeta sp. DS3sAY3a]
MSVHEARFRHLLHEALESSPPGASLTPATFTLITAVCAKVCHFIPSDMFPLGEILADTFFEASRSCFLSYADTDLENPCADSITIRYLHSNCLHTRAQPTIAWHVYGETIRLVQRMRLHSEETYASLSPVEAEMCRHAFWHVFVGDKSLAVLRGMPITIHEYSFDEGITTAYASNEQNEYNLGATIGIQIWRHAADLLLRMRVIKANYTTSHDLSRPLLTPADHASLDQIYVRFATCIDDLPVHLLPDNISLSSSHASSTSNKFATQITDIHVTYLTLKLHLVEKLEDTGYFSGESKDMLVLRKTEIAREMVRLLQNLPLWALKMNGEPCAEKIRLVGVSLIAIIQDGSPFEVRARRDFAVLLDILSQLDSKASDSLHHELL